MSDHSRATPEERGLAAEMTDDALLASMKEFAYSGEMGSLTAAELQEFCRRFEERMKGEW